MRKCCNSIFALHLSHFTNSVACSFSTTSDGFWSDSGDNLWDGSPHGQDQLSLLMQPLTQVAHMRWWWYVVSIGWSTMC